MDVREDGVVFACEGETLVGVITRGARFFAVAALLRLFGEPIRDFIEKRLDWVMLGVLVVVVGGFVVARYAI